ncbi:MAG: hypothetical protein QOH48_1026 [Actinomycetota bacterium]|nr:hypothetical protein [Actinomycetota bacterium]
MDTAESAPWIHDPRGAWLKFPQGEVDALRMKSSATLVKWLRPESVALAFGPTRRSGTERLLAVSTVLFIFVFALRFLLVSPHDLVLLFCVVPIALVAIALGTVGGLAAAIFTYGVFVAWVIITGADVDPLAHISRALSFCSIGVLVGYFTTQARLLEEQSTRWFELSLDINAAAGLDGYWKRVNPAFLQTLGYAEQELLGQPFLNFVHPEDRQSTTEAAAKLALGVDIVGFQNRYRAKDGSYHWIEWACRTVLSEGLIYASGKDVTVRKELEHQLRHLAQHDSLTGLFNRRRFDEELSRQLAHVTRHHSSAALFIMDLDHFKLVNDTYGHATGDDVLRTVGDILRRSLRASDVAARLGGDEFAVILDEGSAEAEVTAGKLIGAMRESFANNEAAASPSLSIGIALVDPTISHLPGTVMHRADQAMYNAKWQGGDSYSFYTEVNPDDSLMTERGPYDVSKLERD